jgi:hypothetical protein
MRRGLIASCQPNAMLSSRSICSSCHLTTGVRSHHNVVEHRQGTTSSRRCCSVRGRFHVISGHGPNCRNFQLCFVVRLTFYQYITFPFLDSPRQNKTKQDNVPWTLPDRSSLEQAAVSVPPRVLTVSRLAARECQC